MDTEQKGGTFQSLQYRFEHVSFTHPPRESNYQSVRDYKLAKKVWWTLALLFVAFVAVQVMTLYSKGFRYAETGIVHSDYRVRYPFFDVCEDTSGVEADVSSPGLIYDPAQHVETRVNMEVPSFRAIVNGATKNYPTQVSFFVTGKDDRFRCNRFTAKQSINFKDISPADRIVLALTLTISETEGKIPQERLRGKASDSVRWVQGLLFRLSLASDPKDAWAFQRETLHGIHLSKVNLPSKDSCAQVRYTHRIHGEQQEFRWKDDFLDYFPSKWLEKIGLNPPEPRHIFHRTWHGSDYREACGPRQGTEIHFRLDFNDGATTAVTTYSRNFIGAVLSSISNCVAMLAIFSLMECFFLSVYESVTDRLATDISFWPRRHVKEADGDTARTETEPLLHAHGEDA